jgi:hypothetical protein
MAKTMSFKAGVKRHPEITVRPVSARDWQQRFQSNPPTSLEALLIKLGPFQAGQPNAIPNPIPNRDAFEFDNYVFSFTGERVEQIRQRYLLATDMVLGGRPLQLVRDVLNRLSVDIPLIGRVGLPKFIKDAVVGDVVSELTRLLGLILDWREPQFGECGGMAFSGYDFYLLGWTVDGRLGTTAPSTDVLDDYIFDRLLDSLELNARTFLEWFIILHRWQELATVANATLGSLVGSVGGPIGAAFGALLGTHVHVFNGVGDRKTLLELSRAEWPRIKSTLDTQAACPVGCIFSDSDWPINDHQVLAVGYEDPGTGTATLNIWDNYDGPSQRDVLLDFTGDELKVSYWRHDRPLKGIFLEAYFPRQPPDSLHLP